MRSVAEIQAEIDQVSAELAQAQRELEQYEASATEEQKAQDADPEWRLARQRYIDTGDMSGVNGWYTRQDQRKRDELDRKRYEQEQARLEDEREKEKASTLEKLEREAIDADAAYKDLVAVYENNKTPANQAAMNGAKRKRDWAVKDYIKEGGDRTKFRTEQADDPVDANDEAPADGTNDYVDNTEVQVGIEKRVNALVEQAKTLRGMKYALRATKANMAKAPKNADYVALVNDIDKWLADDRVSQDTKKYLNEQKTTLQESVRGWTDQDYKDNGDKWPDYDKSGAGGGTGGTGEKVVKKEVAAAAAVVPYSPALRQDAQAGKTVTLNGVEFTLSYDKGTHQIILKNGSNKFTIQAQ